MDQRLTNENQAYVMLMNSHVYTLAERIRQIPPDRWEWQSEPFAPSPRQLAEHAWQWMVCDRQHITEPDAHAHPDVPPPPDDPQALGDLLLAEAKTWQAMLLALTPAQFDAPRSQLGVAPANVRWFVVHMLQNLIYKHGQFATIHFTLGLDGTAPYEAPLPNPYYALMRSGELTEES